MAYFDKGDYDRAIADYGEALRLAPKDARTYYHRGAAYGMKGDDDKELADYAAAIRVDPKFTAAFRARSAALEKHGDRLRAQGRLCPGDRHLHRGPPDRSEGTQEEQDGEGRVGNPSGQGVLRGPTAVALLVLQQEAGPSLYHDGSFSLRPSASSRKLA